MPNVGSLTMVRIVAGALLATCTLAASLPVRAAEPAPQAAPDAKPDAKPEAAGTAPRQLKHALYVRYCSACHGVVGAGDGVAATYMTPRPTDLTQIMKKHDDTFPFQGTMGILEGTNNIRAHGTPEVPVWGEPWAESTATTPDQRADQHGKVVLITEYLMSIQDRPPIELHFVPGQQKKP